MAIIFVRGNGAPVETGGHSPNFQVAAPSSDSVAACKGPLARRRRTAWLGSRQVNNAREKNHASDRMYIPRRLFHRLGRGAFKRDVLVAAGISRRDDAKKRDPACLARA